MKPDKYSTRIIELKPNRFFERFGPPQLNKINIYLLQNDLDNTQELYNQFEDGIFSKMGVVINCA